MLSADAATEWQLPESRVCRLLHMLDIEDGPCLVHLADTTHYILAVLDDAPLARLSRRFSARPLSSFTGAMIEIRRGRLKVASQATANVVLFVDDFAVVGGTVAGEDATTINRMFVMQAERVRNSASLFKNRNKGGAKETDTCDLLELDTLCSQYVNNDFDSDSALSIEEEDCLIPPNQNAAISAMIEGRHEEIILMSSQPCSQNDHHVTGSQTDGNQQDRSIENVAIEIIHTQCAIDSTLYDHDSQIQVDFKDEGKCNEQCSLENTNEKSLTEANDETKQIDQGINNDNIDISNEKRIKSLAADIPVDENIPQVPMKGLPIKRPSGAVDYSKWAF